MHIDEYLEQLHEQENLLEVKLPGMIGSLKKAYKKKDKKGILKALNSVPDTPLPKAMNAAKKQYGSEYEKNLKDAKKAISGSKVDGNQGVAFSLAAIACLSKKSVGDLTKGKNMKQISSSGWALVMLGMFMLAISGAILVTTGHIFIFTTIFGIVNVVRGLMMQEETDQPQWN